MPSHPTLQIVVCSVAIGAAVVSFVVYLLTTFNVVKPSSQHEIEQNAATTRSLAPDPGQAAELIKALASLATSLAKAGPALWSLMSSALFLLIAALAAGVFQSAPPSTTDKRPAASNVSADADRNEGTQTGNAGLPADENAPLRRP